MANNNSNVWVCCDTTFTQVEIVEHLKTVHNVEQPIQGTRRMVTRLDAPEWSQSIYEWTVGDLVLRQNVRTERADDDMMRFI